MRRTKEWWAALSKEERCHLIWIERQQYHCGQLGGYLPDDCGYCGSCGNPSFGGRLCRFCLDDLIELVDKADQAGLSQPIASLVAQKGKG